MMSDNARSIVLLFDECHTRIQTVSELLLISCIPRPVFTRLDDLALTKDNFVRYRDKVIGQLNRMLILSRDIATQVHAKQIQWKPFCHRTQELTSAVIHLSELSAHIAYLIAINTAGSGPAVPGPVANIHQLTQANLDIKFSCTRLKRSRINDLQPHLLVELCGTLTKSLTAMTDICRQAADKISDSNNQDQFKLCVKAITSTTGCLVSSIKSFKHQPSDTHFRRVVTFCDPVISTSGALLNFASEESFIGVPAVLSAEGLEAYRSIVALSMSIASANIQICRAVRDLVYSSSTKRQQDRMSLCVESVTRSSSQLRDLLLSHEFLPKSPTDTHRNVDLDGNVQSQVPPKLSGLFPTSSGKMEFLQSVEGDRTATTNLPLTPRSSVERDVNKTETVNPVYDVGDFHKQENNQRTKSVSPPLSSSPLSSRPSSVVGEAFSDGNMNRMSPQHFSLSPLSISSSSLASTSSYTEGEENIEGTILSALESKE